MAKGKKVEDSITIISQLMMPSDANSMGNVHGGTILSMADKVAAVCAMRHSNLRCVTVSVDRIDFKEPIKVGELVIMKASVNYVGNTSMEIGIRVEAEDPMNGKKRHTNTCYLTYVALDKKGRPIRVPRLILSTIDEKRRFKEAETRVRERLRTVKRRE